MNRRRFLWTGIATAAGTTTAVGYRWLLDDATPPAGTIRVVQAPSPAPAPSPLVIPSASPMSGVDLEVERQLMRYADDDRARSWQRMQERRQAVATGEPPATATGSNAIDMAPELAWQP